MAVVVTVLLAVVAFFLVLGPLLGEVDERPRADAPGRSALEARRDAVLSALKDLELDLAMGKLTEREHAQLDAELRSQLVGMLRELDQGDGDSSGGEAGDPGRAVGDPEGEPAAEAPGERA